MSQLNMMVNVVIFQGQFVANGFGDPYQRRHFRTCDSSVEEGSDHVPKNGSLVQGTSKSSL